MLTFYTGDAGHADIVYYANEKKSAIAPKITDQGADSVSYQVNAVFAQTLLGGVTLSLAESLSSFADEDDWDGRIAVVADHVREMADAFDDASGVLSLYGSLARSCEDLSRHSADLATQASTALDETLSAATGRADAVPATVDALKGSADTLKSSLADSAAAFGAVSDSVDALFDAASGDSKDIARRLARPGRRACVPCDGVPPGGRQLGRRRSVAAREPPAPSDRLGRPREGGGVPGGFHGREPADGRR